MHGNKFHLFSSYFEGESPFSALGVGVGRVRNYLVAERFVNFFLVSFSLYFN